MSCCRAQFGTFDQRYYYLFFFFLKLQSCRIWGALSRRPKSSYESKRSRLLFAQNEQLMTPLPRIGLTLPGKNEFRIGTFRIRKSLSWELTGHFSTIWNLRASSRTKTINTTQNMNMPQRTLHTVVPTQSAGSMEQPRSLAVMCSRYQGPPS
jgi:hypothetical protein